jgi:hypothetical protein
VCSDGGGRSRRAQRSYEFSGLRILLLDLTAPDRWVPTLEDADPEPRRARAPRAESVVRASAGVSIATTHASPKQGPAALVGSSQAQRLLVAPAEREGAATSIFTRGLGCLPDLLAGVPRLCCPSLCGRSWTTGEGDGHRL